MRKITLSFLHFSDHIEILGKKDDYGVFRPMDNYGYGICKSFEKWIVRRIYDLVFADDIESVPIEELFSYRVTCGIQVFTYATFTYQTKTNINRINLEACVPEEKWIHREELAEYLMYRPWYHDAVNNPRLMLRI